MLEIIYYAFKILGEGFEEYDSYTGVSKHRIHLYAKGNYYTISQVNKHYPNLTFYIPDEMGNDAVSRTSSFIRQHFELIEDDPVVTLEKNIINEMNPKTIKSLALREKTNNVNSKYLKDLIRYKFGNYINFESFIYDKLNQNESINRFPGIIDLVINELISYTDNKFKEIKNIINKPDDTFLDNIVYTVIDNLSEKYSSDFMTNYGAMTRQQLDDELDLAVDNSDIRKIKEIREYVSEKYRFSSFTSFIKENKNVSLKILKSVKKDESDKNYLRLVALLKRHREQCMMCHGKGSNIVETEDNKKITKKCEYCDGIGEITLPAKNGYLGFFTHLGYIEKATFSEIHKLYYRLHKLKGILDELPKDVIEYTNYEKINDDLTTIERDQKAMIVLRRFPPKQKDMLMSNFSKKTKESLIKLYDLDEQEKINITTFFKKISVYKSKSAIEKAIINLLDSVSNKSVFMDRVKCEMEAELLYDSEDLTIIKHLSYDCTENLGKGTAWCISRDMSYWLQYVQNGDYCLEQIIDWTKPQTNPESMIGAVFCGNYNGYDYSDAYFKDDSYCDDDYIRKLLMKNGIDKSLFDEMLKKSRPNRDYTEERESHDEYHGW